MKRMLTVTWALALTTNSPCPALSASLPQRLAVVGETKVYSNEADYPSFPGFVRGDKGLALLFTVQPLTELKASGLHPHYAPVIQYRYALSADNGRSWNTPEPLPVWGHPPFLLQLRSGNLLTVYGHRRSPFSVRAILSHDRGDSWDLGSMIELHRFEPGNYDIGYPVATELENGEILGVYYGHSTKDLGMCSPHGVFCTRLKEAIVVSPGKP